jgi:hypothetical protein
MSDKLISNINMLRHFQHLSKRDTVNVLVEKAIGILRTLPRQGEVFPTNNNSIQIEYENDGDYLEIEIFVDSINVYSEIEGVTTTKKVTENELIKIINKFN